MELTIKDRLMIIGMLPQEGSLEDMVDIYDLVRELRLTDEEKALINYNENGKSIIWDTDKDPKKDVNLSSNQLSIFNKTIDNLDKQKKIGLGQIETILKIRHGKL